MINLCFIVASIAFTQLTSDQFMSSGLVVFLAAIVMLKVSILYNGKYVLFFRICFYID